MIEILGFQDWTCGSSLSSERERREQVKWETKVENLHISGGEEILSIWKKKKELRFSYLVINFVKPPLSNRYILHQ